MQVSRRFFMAKWLL